MYLHSIFTLGETSEEGERVATEFEFDLTFLLSLRGSSSFFTFFFFFFQNLPQRDENNDPFSPTFSQILDLTDFDPKLVCLRFLFHSSKVKERLRPTDSTKETRNKKTTDGVRLVGPSN